MLIGGFAGRYLSAGCDTDCGFAPLGWWFIVPGIILIAVALALFVLVALERRQRNRR